MPIDIIAAAEDQLLAAIAMRLLQECGDKYQLQGRIQTLNGSVELDKKARKWNQSAINGNVHFVLRDLDTLASPQDSKYCPAKKIAKLLEKAEKHRRFLFCIAVAEAENWLLGDFENLCQFLKCSVKVQQPAPDTIKNGKEFLRDLVQCSRSKTIREGLSPHGTAKVGPLWNALLPQFVREDWCPAIAAERSKSLRFTRTRLRDFEKPCGRRS